MKKFLTVLFTLLIVGGMAANAGAWDIVLGDAYDISGYWALDINFTGLETDNLNDLNIAVGYDVESVSWHGVAQHDYDDGGIPAVPIWDGGALPYDATGYSGLTSDIMGGEILGNAGVFFPVATDQTLLFSVYFNDLGTADDSSVYFVYGSDLSDEAVDSVMVNNDRYRNHDGPNGLIITADTISPVPVPAALWLVGSAMLGLMGIRSGRKNC